MCITWAPPRRTSSPSSRSGTRERCRATRTSSLGFFRFDDFAHFITIYLSVVELIRTAEDVRLLTYEVGADMATQNIRYAELTVTPYLSVSDQLPAEAFLEAIEDARVAAARDHGVELRWIFDIPADFGIPG